MSSLGTNEPLAQTLTYDFVVNNFVPVKDPASIFYTANAFLPDPAKPKRIIGLNICRRQITSLDSLLNFEHLQFLDASENAISDVSVLSLLNDLRRIDLCFNKIVNIEPLASLILLRKLSVIGNRLEYVPSTMANMGAPLLWHDDRKERGIVIGANPLPEKLVELLRVPDASQQQIRDYLNAQPGRATVSHKPIKETRILIVGPGGVGKTSLSNVLQKQDMREAEPATKGVKIGSLTTLSNGERFLFKLWDFGGQTAQFSLHRLFFTDRSVFMLVLDSRNEDTPETWLDYISSFSPDAPIFVILSKVDKFDTFDVDRATIRRQWPKIIGIFRTSAQTEAGIPDLLDALRKFSEDANCPSVVIEPNLATARQHFIKIRSERPFLDQREFEQLLENAGIPKEEWTMTIESLESLGEILSHKSFDTIVIDPDWLAKTVVETILSAQLIEAKGEMAYHEFLNLLEPHTRRYTAYGRELQKFVLEMMKRYELCHVYSGNAASREKVVVPSAFSRQSPENAANHVCGLQVKIFLNFNPTTILQKIVVRCLRDGMTAPNCQTQLRISRFRNINQPVLNSFQSTKANLSHLSERITGSKNVRAFQRGNSQPPCDFG